MAYFVKRNIDIVIIACNTICSVALQELKENYPKIVFFDVINPTVSKILESKLIIGTSTTIKSKVY